MRSMNGEKLMTQIKNEYEYYDHCSCGGEFKSRSGATMDMYPCSYPVECKECGKKCNANLLAQCLDAGWGEPEWRKRKNEGL